MKTEHVKDRVKFVLPAVSPEQTIERETCSDLMLLEGIKQNNCFVMMDFSNSIFQAVILCIVQPVYRLNTGIYLSDFICKKTQTFCYCALISFIDMRVSLGFVCVVQHCFPNIR